MSEIGYYRYKVAMESINSRTDINLMVDGDLVATKYLIFHPFCNEGKVLKYLNKNGQYRFFPFNKFFELRDSPQLIGTFENFEQGLIETKSNTSVVGFKNTKIYSLSNDNVSRQELEIFSDIHTSPRVYLYKGDYTSFLDSDYIEVTIKGDPLIRPRKNNYVSVNLTVEIENQNTISLV